jgi:hypothetical protein
MDQLTRRLAPAILGAVLAAAARVAPAAQSPAATPTISARSQNGKYVVRLRPLPPGGLYAQEDNDIEFFVGDITRDDPIFGPAPVIRADVRGRFSMPAMPGMPEAVSQAHVEGQPGYYGVVAALPHGGDYVLNLLVRPPVDQPFSVQIPLKVKDAQPGRVRPQPFTAQMETSPPTVRAGEPAELRFRVLARQAPGIPVREFELVHEQLMHVMVVSRNLAYFQHVHPEFDPGTGTFTLKFTFPAGGQYRIFLDTAPKDAGSQILTASLNVPGPAASTPPPLTPTEPLQTAAGGVAIDIQPSDRPLKARTDQTLAMTFTVGGAPATDIQPWLGAMAHLALINEDATTFVHTHPQEVIPPAGQPKPHALHFYTRFPKPGLYKGWVQFERAGEVHTAPFVLRVAPEG